MQVHQFGSYQLWPDQIEIGAGARVIEDIRRNRFGPMNSDEIVAWLREVLIISAANDQNSRLLVSAGSDERSAAQTSFEILGSGFVGKIRRSKERRLRLDSLRRVRRVHQSDRRPIVLVQANVQFVNGVDSAELRCGVGRQLEQLAKQANSYLKFWSDCNEIECKSIMRRSREVGFIRYSHATPLDDGAWRFTVSEPSKVIRKLANIRESGDVAFEAIERVPAGDWRLIEEDVDANEKISEIFERPGAHGAPHAFIGQIRAMESDRGFLEISPPADDEVELQPPRQGYLFVSLQGDSKRIARRIRAERDIRLAHCPMLNLGLLLENQRVPVERSVPQRRKIPPSVQNVIGGTPTPRQKEALRIMMNTPGHCSHSRSSRHGQDPSDCRHLCMARG